MDEEGHAESFRIGDTVDSWAGKGRIDYIRGDKVKIRLADGSRSKFLNMSGLSKITDSMSHKYTCENCDATFEKDEAHDLYKAYEILERPTKCPHCGAEASIW